MRSDLGKAYLTAPGADEAVEVASPTMEKNSIDFVYWDGIPNVRLNGKALDFSFADAKAVRGLLKGQHAAVVRQCTREDHRVDVAASGGEAVGGGS